MPSAPGTPVPILMRQPSFHPATVEWAPGTPTSFVLIKPMYPSNLQDKTKTFADRAVEKIKAVSEKWFTHVLLLLFLVIYGVLGALLFQWLEQEKEDLKKDSVAGARDLTIIQLWRLAHDSNLTEDQWRDAARRDLIEYESQVEVLLKSQTVADSENGVWSFRGGLFYCGTVFTTIGYGNIYPETTAGQAVTMIYAFFGIPLLLMVLADLGKLFTRWIKALFYYVKLFYHTGKFRKARRMGRRATVKYMSVALNKMPYAMSPGRSRKKQDAEYGSYSINVMDDDKSNRETSEEGSEILPKIHFVGDISEENGKKKSKRHKTKEEEEAEDAAALAAITMENEVDDEFNLPVSLAVIVLVAYMMLGAFLFTLWEEWSFFESFYFLFVSMSTIGFGDYVPDHPLSTFIYLLFGLALTSMCINVVQEKLSAIFEMASLKIGTTVGLDASMFMAEEVYQERGDTPDSQNTKSSLKSRRGSKVPPAKSSDKDTETDEDEKKRQSGSSDSDKSPQQFENGTIKKRPDTLGVPTTTTL